MEDALSGGALETLLVYLTGEKEFAAFLQDRNLVEISDSMTKLMSEALSHTPSKENLAKFLCNMALCLISQVKQLDTQLVAAHELTLRQETKIKRFEVEYADLQARLGRSRQAERDVERERDDLKQEVKAQDKVITDLQSQLTILIKEAIRQLAQETSTPPSLTPICLESQEAKQELHTLKDRVQGIGSPAMEEIGAKTRVPPKAYADPDPSSKHRRLGKVSADWGGSLPSGTSTMLTMHLVDT